MLCLQIPAKTANNKIKFSTNISTYTVYVARRRVTLHVGRVTRPLTMHWNYSRFASRFRWFPAFSLYPRRC